MEENKNNDFELENKKPEKSLPTQFMAGILTGLILALVIISCVYFANVISRDKTGDNLAENNATGSVVENNASDDESTNAQAFQNILEKENYLMALFENFYYYDVDMTVFEEALCDAMIQSLGDRYAAYYTVDEFASLKETTSGSYYGIGVVARQDLETKVITIGSIYEDGPAHEAGLQIGDILTAVDGESVADMDLSSVVAIIKGESGSEVVLTIVRDGEEMDISVMRGEVVVDSVAYEMVDDMLYIYIQAFEDNTPDQFAEALAFGTENGAKGIIFDIRGNGGGSLTSIKNILDQLIAEGMLVYVEDKNGNRVEHVAEDDLSVDLPMVVLANEYSASAAELFAGTLQDYGLATIVGKTTYGKGVVQTLRQLPDGSALKFTTSSYFTAKGVCVDGVGVIPDIEVELNEDAVGDNGYVIRDKDQQFKAAYDELKKLIG